MTEFNPLLLPSAVLVIGILVSLFNKQFSLGFFGFAASLIVGSMIPQNNFQKVLTLFPSALFLQLMGLFLFFALVEESNLLITLISKSLPKFAKRLALLPIFVFCLTAVLSASGLGNISTLALLAPFGLMIAEKVKMPLFPMTLLLVGGANASYFCGVFDFGWLGLDSSTLKAGFDFYR